MARVIIIITIFFLAGSILATDEKITLDVYSAIEMKEDVILEVDGIEVGPLPVRVVDLPVGKHEFGLWWTDGGKIPHHRTDTINITESMGRIYLSPIKKTSGARPFLYGLLGGSGGALIFLFFILIG